MIILDDVDVSLNIFQYTDWSEEVNTQELNNMVEILYYFSNNKEGSNLGASLLGGNSSF